MAEITEDLLLGGRVRLLQPARGHRAGTDAVLLAAAGPAGPGETVMDVGAATGAVGLMVAAREKSAHVVFVERDPALAEICRRNCESNGVRGRVAMADILDKASRRAAGLEPGSADLVLTNPPFLEEGRARLSPDPAKAAAHALPAGGLEAWLRACAGWLRPGGRLVLIHRADRLADCLAPMGKRLGKGLGNGLSRSVGVGGLALRFVHPAADQPAIRLLVSGTKGSRAPLSVLPPVVLNGPDGRFTPQAEALHRGEATLL